MVRGCAAVEGKPIRLGEVMVVVVVVEGFRGVLEKVGWEEAASRQQLWRPLGQEYDVVVSAGGGGAAVDDDDEES